MLYNLNLFKGQVSGMFPLHLQLCREYNGQNQFYRVGDVAPTNAGGKHSV